MKDDPDGLRHFEWTRLRDPATGKIPEGIRKKELEFAARLPRRVDLAKTSGDAAADAATLNRRGPHNLGGRTRALAVDAANSSVVIAGGVSGGVWRSTDSGTSWSKMTLPADLHSVSCIAQDTRVGKTGTWYVGTGEYRGNSAGGSGAPYLGNGIYKSTDSGLSWSVLPATATSGATSFDQKFDFVWNIVTDPSSGVDEVYAAVSGCIVRSTDGGSTWSTVLGGFSGNNSAYTDVAVSQAGVLYAALSDYSLSATSGSLTRGIFRSADGVNWTNITPSTGFPGQYQRIVIGIAPSNPSVVYFLMTVANGTEGTDQINGNQFWKYTYVSGDGSGAGGTWENRGRNLPNEAGLTGNARFDTQGSYDMLVRVKPDDQDFVVVGGTNLYVSTDGFATTTNWRRVGGYAGPNTYAWYTNHHPDQHSGVFLGDNRTFISGHDEGVSRTSNITLPSVSWTTLNQGYYTTQFYTLAIDHGTPGNNVVIGGMQDNGTWFVNSSSLTATWVGLLGGDGAACAIADGRSSYYVSSQNGVAYRLVLDANGGLLDYARIDPTGASGYLFINPFTLDPSNQAVMYLAGGSLLWRNSDLTGIPTYTTYNPPPGKSNDTTSVNWTKMTGCEVAGDVITALGVSTANPANRLYFGTRDGKVFRLESARTVAASTVPVNITAGIAGGYVSSISVDPSDGNAVLLTVSNYGVVSIYHSTNAGALWTNVEGNLSGSNGPSCRSGIIGRVGSIVTYFVGTSTGLYSTQQLNGGSTVWAQEGASSIGNVVVDMVDFRGSDGLIVAGTHGAGVFSGTIPATGVEAATRPLATALLPNYPNPFNPTTRITYRLSAPGDVRLSVVDLLGHEVTVLVNGRQPAGTYAVPFDASGLASGTYFSRLQAGPYTETRKMLYLR